MPIFTRKNVLLRARSSDLQGFPLGYAPQRALFGRPALFILSLFQLCLHLSDSCLKCLQITTDLVLFLIGLEFILNR